MSVRKARLKTGFFLKTESRAICKKILPYIGDIKLLYCKPYLFMLILMHAVDRANK